MPTILTRIGTDAYRLASDNLVSDNYYATPDSSILLASDVAVNQTNGDVSVLTNYFASGQYLIRTYNSSLQWQRDFYTPRNPTAAQSDSQYVAGYSQTVSAAVNLEVGADGTHYVLFTTTSGEFGQTSNGNIDTPSSVGLQTRVLGVQPPSGTGIQAPGQVVYYSYLKPDTYGSASQMDQHSPVSQPGGFQPSLSTVLGISQSLCTGAGRRFRGCGQSSPCFVEPLDTKAINLPFRHRCLSGTANAGSGTAIAQ